MKITKELLQKHRACEEQVEIFESLFPLGMNVSYESCLEANFAGIDFEWLSKTLLKDTEGFASIRNHLHNDYIGRNLPPVGKYRDNMLSPSYGEYYRLLAIQFCEQFNKETIWRSTGRVM